MNLATELLHQIELPGLSDQEKALLRCQLARQLEEAGNYEAAREAMGELWQRVGDAPVLKGLDEHAKGEVLLRAGVLTGWLGSTKQVSGAQETAKDLISQSFTIFQTGHEVTKTAEANIELAVCYWREGAFDEARIRFAEAVHSLDDKDADLKALALLRSAAVEKVDSRLRDALRILSDIAPLLESSTNHTLKGRFHNELGTVLENICAAEGHQSYRDRALIEYAAASFYFEQAGHTRYQACVENNLGFLFSTIRKFADAHEHLDRAQVLFTRLKDNVHLAQVDETRARVMLAEGRLVAAEKLCRRAVRALEKGDEQSLFAEALTTHGIALAHLQHHQKARTALELAINVAQKTGDLESAGLAALTLVEELGLQISNDDLCATVERAATLLEKTRNMVSLRRLAKCAGRALSLVHALAARPDWTTFSLKEALCRYEAQFLELALKDSGGSVTRAARLLGLPSHQTLLSMLNTRHKNLLKDRKPIRARRQSIIRDGAAAHRSRSKVRSKARAIRILHVEDDSVVANMMKETLALEGWEVEICADGTAAMEQITSHRHYDLLLLDYDLPGVNGVQLIQQTRNLAHRQAIPIIILSATLDEMAAREAGADASLRKPEDISTVADTVTRLLQSAKA